MRQIFVLGATGFIGQELVREAIRAGWQVKALARSEKGAGLLRQLGAEPVTGDVLDTLSWIHQAETTDVIVDLVQPALPDRLSYRKMKDITAFRLRATASMLEALRTIPSGTRPLLLSVSGTDDLLPETDGRIHSGSPLRNKAFGFGQIGIPVRKLIEMSGIEAVHVHLGHVYGPGKGFAAKVFPAIARGKFPVMGRGDNKLPLVHVEDAARALIHVVGLQKQLIVGKSFVVADETPVTLKEFINTVVAAIHAPAPKHIPRWVAAIVAGKPMTRELTANLIADPAELLNTGFRFRYPSCHDGLPSTLLALGLSIHKIQENDHA